MKRLFLKLFFIIIGNMTLFEYAIGQVVIDPTHINASHYILSADNELHLLNIIDVNSNKLVRQIKLQNRQGKLSTISFVFHSKKRQSVIASLPEINELWEMSYKEPADPVYDGWVHDYQMGEGIADTAIFAPRRTMLEISLTCFAFDADGTYLAGADLYGRLQIINLDIRRKIAAQQFLSRVYPCDSEIKYTKNGALLYLKVEEKKDNLDNLQNLNTLPNLQDHQKKIPKILGIDMKTGRILELERVDIP